MKYFKIYELNDCYGQELIKINSEQVKKDLTGSDYMYLYGALVLMCRYNEEVMELYGLTVNDVINNSCMQDSELYLNSFEGYELSERLVLRTIYMNEFDNIIFSIYDRKKDKFINFA